MFVVCQKAGKAGRAGSKGGNCAEIDLIYERRQTSIVLCDRRLLAFCVLAANGAHTYTRSNFANGK